MKTESGMRVLVSSILCLGLVLLMSATVKANTAVKSQATTKTEATSVKKSEKKEVSMTSDKNAHTEVAYLAGGCFWGVQDLIRKIPGVIHTEVGYSGGDSADPTYDLVKTGRSGHAEAVKIEFDSKKVSFLVILDHFFRLHDPTTLNQQGNDIGTQYRSAIFYVSDEQKKIAEAKKQEVEHSKKWKRPVVTAIVPFKKFYKAEDYHQDYLEKNPGGYTCHYYRD